jgi:hypothetical protein
VPPGNYRLTVWHPGLPANTMPTAVPLEIAATDLTHAVKLAINLDP